MSKTAPKKKATKTAADVYDYLITVRSNILSRLSDMEDRMDKRLTAIEGSVNMLGQRIDAMRHEQVALSQESRSALAEDKAKEEQRVMEEERAKELAKPLEFDAKVKYRDRDGVYLYPDPQGSHRLALKGTPEQCAAIVFAMRSEFQIID